MTSTINATSSSGIVSTADNSTTLALQTNGTTAVYVDASQNVGIGTTSPSYALDVGGLTTIKSSIRIQNGTAGSSFLLQSDTSGLAYVQQQANAALVFATNNSERARIDSSGNLLVGTTTSSLISGNTATDGTAVAFGSINSARSALEPLLLNKLGSNGNVASFWKAGVFVGSVSVTGTATTYNTTSDYRLKENVTPLTNGLATIIALKPVSYDWISDKSQGEGFIAHELQEIIPLAVTGTKDAVDDEGDMKPQCVDYSKIVVHLVSAVQELSAKIDAQASEIAALKAKVGA